MRDHLRIHLTEMQDSETFWFYQDFHPKMRVQKSSELSPVSQELVKPDDEVLFFFSYVAPLEIGTEIVKPSKPTTLPTSLEAC